MSQDWAGALDRLADRIERLTTGDASKTDRGARRRGGALGIEPDALPAALRSLGQYLPLDDIDLARLLCGVAPSLDP